MIEGCEKTLKSTENYQTTLDRLHLLEGRSEVEELRDEVSKLRVQLTKKNLKIETLERMTRNTAASKKKFIKSANYQMQRNLRSQKEKINQLNSIIDGLRKKISKQNTFIKFIKNRINNLASRKLWTDIVNCVENPCDEYRVKDVKSYIDYKSEDNFEYPVEFDDLWEIHDPLHFSRKRVAFGIYKKMREEK